MNIQRTFNKGFCHKCLQVKDDSPREKVLMHVTPQNIIMTLGRKNLNEAITFNNISIFVLLVDYVL